MVPGLSEAKGYAYVVGKKDRLWQTMCEKLGLEDDSCRRGEEG